MTVSYQELLEESQRHGAYLEGQLAELHNQLAATLASEDQLRQQLETSRVELGAAVAALSQAQREAAEREASLLRRFNELEDQLADARRMRQQAEKERAAVISALSWRARRRLSHQADHDLIESEHERG